MTIYSSLDILFLFLYNLGGMDNFYLFGVKVNRVDSSDVLKNISAFIKEGRPHLIVTLGTEMLILAQKDSLFKEIINRADLVTPDGAGIVWAHGKFGNILKGKVAGIDLIEKICQFSLKEGWRIYFLGAKEEVVKKAVDNLKKKYPALAVAGYHNGYFQNDDEIIKEINSSSANILFLALGSPKQERWFYENRSKLKTSVCMGVGGSLDIISGIKKRAPEWMIKAGLEWLYRLIQEPKRFARMLAIPRLIYMVYCYKFLKK